MLVESGEPREVADLALLLGYGAGAVNPYLAFESIHAMVRDGSITGVDAPTADKNYVKALKKGLLKVLSKMGISTLSSYHGAQIFEAVGIAQPVIERVLSPGTRVAARRRVARGDRARSDHAARERVPRAARRQGARRGRGLRLARRARGRAAPVEPEVDPAKSLQKAVRLEDAKSYEEYARLINAQASGGTEGAPAFTTLRGMWDFRLAEGGTPVPLEEVEPAKEIVKPAIRPPGRCRLREHQPGGAREPRHRDEPPRRGRIEHRRRGRGRSAVVQRLRRGDLRRSAIKQVASARFRGDDALTLGVNADELQIKMAQGAKPGEGGQLPGHKVSEEIARVRHSTPGVTLISPPPHHDIYSIEDLAQLIFDLKNVNPRARVSVKLVSESGVGTVAAGVAKAHADHILIAGHDGGTGASPLSSIQHAGTPWEIGLAEAQQVLVLNGLRSRVVLQVDGQLKTGRDVAIAALLGAEEFGFATAPLVASGCIMMRKCHLNTCPVGVATQDPELRARFKGTPEHVVNYFFFVAEELRAIMAQLGFRTVAEMVGRVENLAPRTIEEQSAAPGEPGWGAVKARTLDFQAVLAKPARLDAETAQTRAAARDSIAPPQRSPFDDLRCTRKQPDLLAKVLDRTVIGRVWASVDREEPSTMRLTITNADRAFGAMLAGEIALKHGARGLPDDTIRLDVTGTAGQSFGAFAVRGMTITLEGDANDYVGKGLSGGVLAIRPPARCASAADQNVIVGNTVLYGATAGSVFFCGRAGERFAVRNSGARAVVEGVGDHGCEYMTGGLVVILGTTGRNFAAGMSGGIAYVLDEDGAFAARCNPAMVELAPLDGEDEEAVRALVAEHVRRTESVKGRSVLAALARGEAPFVKVLPIEYKRVLEARRLATATPFAQAMSERATPKAAS